MSTSIYERISEIDDADWVKHQGHSLTNIMEALKDLDDDDVRMLLAEYVQMCCRLVHQEESMKGLLILLWAALNHPNQAGKIWIRYDRDTIDRALDNLKEAMRLSGFEFKAEQENSDD